MKIAVLQDHLRSGGSERTALKLTRGLRAAGHDAQLVVFRPGGPLAPLAADLAPSVLQRRDWRLAWPAPGLRRALREFAPDVVLPFGLNANAYGGLLAAGPTPPAGAPHWVATVRTGKPLGWLYRRALRRSAHIVANSRRTAETLTARSPASAARLSVIYNGLVFPPALAPAAAETLRRRTRTTHGAGEETLVLLCVASFRPEKQHNELIEIAARLPRGGDWQLWLAGEGETLAACRALATAHGIEQRIRFLGFQPDPSAFYAAADVAVLTSARESLSNFLIEAQAHGLPALCYDVTGADECLAPDETGLIIEPGARATFATEIVQLGADPQLRTIMGRRARARARELFDADTELRAYLDLFARLCSPRARS